MKRSSVCRKSRDVIGRYIKPPNQNINIILFNQYLQSPRLQDIPLFGVCITFWRASNTVLRIQVNICMHDPKRIHTRQHCITFKALA